MLFQTLITSFLIVSASAHSWVEEIRIIAPNGTFTGDAGYARGNWRRTAAGFNDTTMTYLIPPDGQANITVVYNTTKMCKNSQQTETQSSGSPRLQASPGDAIALRYQENGHVTLPWNQPGKPPNRGTVYVYGTTSPKVGEIFDDVHKVWNWNGTGGDGRGRLLSMQNFDDGRCYQINTGNISEYRQEKYPHEANQLMGADLWCQQDIELPTTAPSGKVYTLYWVWDWPTLPDIDPTYPDGKVEIYTTCIDINVEGSSVNQTDSYASDQSLNSASIESELDDLTSEDAVSWDSAVDQPSASTLTSSSAVQVETSTSASSTEAAVQPTTSVAAGVDSVNSQTSTVTVTVGEITAWRTVTKVEMFDRTVTVTGCPSATGG
ncbi:uncharacterized protein N7483_000642 [Penicillium malachiteum]|uniref:uncharacterized protein n=1 Tax=Penicillium malachiteum TaxID=1324776 RepID=UPI002548C991|nr:uncharacterized protein N7483_000642 [Penicillium malachiteum]KAJ5735517.1 hypothetical protein N7483_000642 [Penicillium malachiteum]